MFRSLPALLLSASIVSAATYYVSPTGSNTADGSEGSPWQTIYYATRHSPFFLSAGDTVLVRGGNYTGNNNAIDLGNGIGNSGTANACITVASYPGETVIVSDIVGAYKGALMTGKAHWTFSGIIWSNCYAAGDLTSCTNFLFTNCTFTTMNPTNWDYPCLRFWGDSQSNRVINCTFTNWGFIETNVPAGNYIMHGTLISFGDESSNPACRYNLVQGCTFGHGGHDCFQLNAGYTVIRSNVFYNDPWQATNATTGWQFYNFGEARVENNEYAQWGARITKPGNGGSGPGGQVDMRNVWEWNTMLYASYPADSDSATGIELATARSIYRFNTIAYCQGSGIYLTPCSATAYCKSNAIYNNVIYGCGMAGALGWNTNAHSFWYGMTVDDYGGYVTNNYIVNNILAGSYPTNVDPVVYTSAVWRTNWNRDFVACTDPLFTSTNGYGYAYNPASLPNFHLLAGSPCIDAGTWLAYASAGGSGTTLAVDNSLYFSDGNRVVTGDTIQLQGQTATATVVSNDWANNTLYLSGSLTWTNGQGVSLPYNGSAPDMGAYESGVPTTGGGNLNAGTLYIH